jgi:hypothetical protein
VDLPLTTAANNVGIRFEPAGTGCMYLMPSTSLCTSKGVQYPPIWSTQMSSIRKVITLAGALAIFAARTLSQVCEVRYE